MEKYSHAREWEYSILNDTNFSQIKINLYVNVFLISIKKEGAFSLALAFIRIKVNLKE